MSNNCQSEHSGNIKIFDMTFSTNNVRLVHFHLDTEGDNNDTPRQGTSQTLFTPLVTSPLLPSPLLPQTRDHQMTMLQFKTLKHKHT